MRWSGVLLDCPGHRTALPAPGVQVAGPTPHYVLGLPNGHDPVRPNARLALTMELPRSSESDACTGLGKSCGVHTSPEVCTHAKPETPLTWDNTGSVGGLQSHTPSVPSGSGVLLAAVQQACVLKPFAPGGASIAVAIRRFIVVFSAWHRTPQRAVMSARCAAPMKRYQSKHNPKEPGMPESSSHWHRSLISPGYGPRRHDCHDTSTLLFTQVPRRSCTPGAPDA